MTIAWVDQEAEDADLDYDDAPLAPEEYGNEDAAPPAAIAERAPERRDFEFVEMVHRIQAERAARNAKVEAGGGVELVVPSTPVAVPDLPVAPRGIAKRCLAAGFDVRTEMTVLEVDDLFYVGSSETHDAGDLRTPGHDLTVWSVQAVLMAPAGRVAAFWATWERADVPGRKTISNAFTSALMWDPLEKRTWTKSATEFDEWLGIFAPKPEPKKKKGEGNAGS